MSPKRQHERGFGGIQSMISSILNSLTIYWSFFIISIFLVEDIKTMDLHNNCSQGTSENRQIASICLMAALSVAIILGNIISLLVFLGSPHFRTPQGYLKASLAIADLAIGILVIPYSIYTEVIGLLAGGLMPERSPTEQELHGFGPCFLVGPVFAGCTLVSVFTIFLLSVERSITVLRPLHKNVLVTKERTVAIILLSWIFCFCLATAPLLSREITLVYSHCSKMCNYIPTPTEEHSHFPIQSAMRGGWSVMLLFPTFDLCLLGATSLLNLLTFTAVRRFCNQRKMVRSPACRQHSAPTYSDLRAAKIILILTALLTASVVPVAVLVVATVLGFTWCHFSLYAFWILACSSGWNVLIYSARDRRFRWRVRELFLGIRGTRDRVRDTATTRSPTAQSQKHLGQWVAVFRQVPTTVLTLALNAGTQHSRPANVSRQMALLLYIASPSTVHRSSAV